MGGPIKTFLSKYGGWLVRILGFIADAYTVIMIFRVADSESPSPLGINPFWALGICCIMFTSYISFLNWVIKKDDPDIKFKDFINKITKLDYPLYFIPIPFFGILILGATIYCIQYAPEFFAILFFISIIVVPTIIMVNAENYEGKARKIIDENWKLISKNIAAKIRNKYFILPSDLKDIIEFYKIDKRYIKLSLIKFAIENNNITKFGNVSSKNGGSDFHDCLINLKEFPNDDYSIT